LGVPHSIASTSIQSKVLIVEIDSIIAMAGAFQTCWKLVSPNQAFVTDSSLHHGRTIFSIPDIAPVGQLPAPAYVSERLPGDVRLLELPAPDRSFRYTLKVRQGGAISGNSSTRTRPVAVGAPMKKQSLNV
jgi:hypothetical protein